MLKSLLPACAALFSMSAALSQVYPGADTSRAGNLNARDVLKHFGEVLVRQLADVFRLNNLDEIRGLPLLIERARKRSANALNDNDVVNLLFLRESSASLHNKRRRDRR